MSIKTYTAYECSVILGAIAAGAVACQLTPNPNNLPPAPNVSVITGLLRLEIVLTTAVASSLALSASNSRGTPTTTTTGNEVRRANGGISFGAVPNMSRVTSAWSAAPTIGSALYRRTVLPATIGASLVWTWPEEDPFTANLSRGVFADTGVVIHNFGAGVTGTMVANFRWFEYTAEF